jgi:hypothetical protein
MTLVHVCHIFPLSLSNLAQPGSCSSPVSHTAALSPVTSKELSFPHFSIKPSSVAGMPIFPNQLLCQGNLANSLPCLSRILPTHAIDSFPFIFDLPRPCSESQLNIEHLAGAVLASSLRADRPSPDPSSHCRPRLSSIGSLAQPCSSSWPFSVRPIPCHSGWTSTEPYAWTLARHPRSRRGSPKRSHSL